jgi:hypothetical protein
MCETGLLSNHPNVRRLSFYARERITVDAREKDYAVYNAL